MSVSSTRSNICTESVLVKLHAVKTYINIAVLQLVTIMCAYVIYFSSTHKFTLMFALHICLTTVGYALLMSEAIMLATTDQFFGHVSQRMKNYAHGICNVLAFAVIFSGYGILIYMKYIRRGCKCDFWEKLKGLDNIAALISIIFIVITFLIGMAVMKYETSQVWNIDIDWLILYHNIFGCLGYSIGMANLGYVFVTRPFITYIPWEYCAAFLAVVILTTLWTMLGPFATIFNHIKKMTTKE